MKRARMIRVTIAMVATAAVFYWLGTRNAGSHASLPAAAAANDQRVLYWYDPMSPQQHFEHPGKSPLMPSMDLVPKYAGETDASAPGVVRIDPAVVQNLGVRTAPVRVAALPRQVRVPATVTWDLRRAVTVSARVDATIARLDVRAPFDPVRKGQPIARVLAPQWSAALAEYRALSAAASPAAKELVAAARQRLRTLGMGDAEIAAGRADGAGVVLQAPLDGVVAQLLVQQGQQVGAGSTLMILNSLDTVWIEADVPQAQMTGIAAGTPVEVTLGALPGRTFKAQVQSVLPQVDAATRAQRVRIVLDNPEHALAPGMFAQVRIDVPAGTAHPLVPDEAVIATGEATRVILAQGDGSFRVVPVQVGASAGGDTQILHGLSGNERVVTSGQFLIDSEASLSGALERLGDSGSDAHEPGHAAMPAGHDEHAAHAEHHP
ncbi:MAG: efflux RND transporter periplasmic adaptor subunit [Proteobacteria bacterium]|nr:efflux RND transporter periplasmic adaptor subunit [Pseudomonadota bacterium]